MTTLFSLLLLAAGVVIIANTVRTRREQTQGFPRYRETVTPGRRLLPILLGAFITLCGAGMLVLARTD